MDGLTWIWEDDVAPLGCGAAVTDVGLKHIGEGGLSLGDVGLG